MAHEWDADLYDRRHAFVTGYGAALLDLLAAQPGERVLDVGCGTGHHVAELAAAGVVAIGLDASEAMVARARRDHPGCRFVVGDVRSWRNPEPFDGVLSNAALHWVPEGDAVAATLAAALRPGGRLVVELGGRGNTAVLLAAVAEARRSAGLPPAELPWWFPSVGEYASILERHGFEIDMAMLFDRPTRLEGGPDGLRAWLAMFGGSWTAGADVDALVPVIERYAAAKLLHGEDWHLDYRRLRVTAHLAG
jgi:trans-aconitate methyltransferase